MRDPEALAGDQRIEQLRLALEAALRKRRFVGRVEPKEAGATIEIGAGVAQNGLMALSALRSPPAPDALKQVADWMGRNARGAT